jgi:hypothetical protein
MAPPRCRGPGPRPSVQFKYNLRTSIRPYLLDQSIVGDNLVSVRPGRASSMSKTNVSCVTNKEVILKDVIAHLTAIEDIVLPLQPLHDQVTTLQATVADQQQQAVFNIALTHVETMMRDRGLGGGNGRCRNAGEEMTIQIFRWSTSLSFPSTMARVTHLPWLNHCNHYFKVRHTLEHKKVLYTTFHVLDDAQLWFHRLELNHDLPNWVRFVQLMNIRFGLPLGDLALLRRDDLVDDYCKQFMVLSCRDPSITKEHQIQMFMTSLDKPLCTVVKLQRPVSLDEAIMFVRAYEQRNVPPSLLAATPPSPRSSGQ